MDPLVLKIGGSLLNSIPRIVQVIRKFPNTPILAVPGGGPFADQVRSRTVSHDEAHWMAIAAMDQYGWYISSMGIEPTDCLQTPLSPQIFLPYKSLRDQDPLPHTWDVTSDTIAAWVAFKLHTDLVLLKSVDGLYQNNGFRERVGEVFPCSEVDAAFLPYVLSHKIRCTILNGSIPQRIESFLRGDSVRCTRVETTL